MSRSSCVLCYSAQSLAFRSFFFFFRKSGWKAVSFGLYFHSDFLQIWLIVLSVRLVEICSISSLLPRDSVVQLRHRFCDIFCRNRSLEFAELSRSIGETVQSVLESSGVPTHGSVNIMICLSPQVVSGIKWLRSGGLT